MLEKLKEMGFNSIDEALTFTKGDNYKSKEDQEPAWTEEKIEENYASTNIAFEAGQTAGETKVYAFDESKNIDIELAGITKASLNYDPELELPVLRLEIINPVIM